MESKSIVSKTIVLSFLFGSGLFFIAKMASTFKIPFSVIWISIFAHFLTGVLVGRIFNYKIKASLIVCVLVVIIRHLIGKIRLLILLFSDDSLFKAILDVLWATFYVASLEILFSVFGLLTVLTVEKLKNRRIKKGERAGSNLD